MFIPPLRERGEDILVLADCFIKKFATKFSKNISGLSEAVKNILLGYPWPGNVRELQNTIEYAINMETGNQITVANLPLQFKEISKGNSLLTLESTELERIKQALNQFGWTENGKIAAANYLGISRSTIYRKIKKL